MRSPLPALVLAAIVVIGGAAGCGRDEIASETGTTVAPSGSSTTSAATSGPSSTSTPTSTGSSTPTSTGTSGSATTTVAPLAAAGTGTRSGPARGTGVALLTDLRFGANAGFDRVVFEFAGANLPEWSVAYDPGPFTEDGSGSPVPVRGQAFLRVQMQGGSGVNLDTGQVTYDGPDRLAGGSGPVIEVVRTGDFEAVMGWVVGSEARVPFRVTALTSPSRLVIDLVRPG